jgi:hypothetical protein
LKQEELFTSSLEYPPSFQKQLSAILLSKYRNEFLSVIVRLVAFLKTFRGIVGEVDEAKIKSKTFRELIKLIRVMNSGKFRAMKLDEFEEAFF